MMSSLREKFSGDKLKNKMEDMKMKKLISLFMLLVIMVGCSLTACRDKSEEEDSEKSVSATTVESNGYVPDSLPELDFNGRKINILSWKSTPYEFSDKLTNNVVEDSLWLRLENVKSRLNITPEIEYIDGSNDYLDQFKQKVQTSILSDSSDTGYDIIVQYSGFGMMGATAGYYIDLNDCKYIDFDKPWWPENLKECLNISDSIYFVSGDISVCRTTGLFAILTNNDILNDYKIKDEPYILAASGKWTLEKMMDMSKDIYTDLDRDDKQSDGDEYGFVFINTVSADAFLEGSGIKMISKSNDGKLVVDSSFLGEKTDTLVNKLSEFIYRNDGVHVNSKYAAVFPEGHAMFMVGKIDTLMYYMDDSTFSYGVLPIPKYDENQANYKTTVNFNYSMYSITKTAANPDEIAAVLEALASEGYRTVSPAVFDKAFKLRYSEDSTISAMFDIIRDSTSFDIGRLSTHTFEAANVKSLVIAFREMVMANTGGWKTVATRFSTQWQGELDVISKAYTDVSA